jgi:protein tyrosine phosphatase (PTP) superfamily phosphohydrolase (DUF442 family)
MRRIRLRRRWPLLFGATYVGTAAFANALIFAGVVAARVSGHAPEVEGDLPKIKKLRRVDDRVFASAQPDPESYEKLATAGVTLVVDLREHVRGDPRVDDELRLRALGIDYVHVPLRDGHAPEPSDVSTVVRAITSRERIALIHCGAGVGRSMSMSAAYLAASGRSISLLEQLGVGPPTLEQIYFLATLRRDRPRLRPWMKVMSRCVVDAPRRLGHSISGR